MTLKHKPTALAPSTGSFLTRLSVVKKLFRCASPRSLRFLALFLTFLAGAGVGQSQEPLQDSGELPQAAKNKEVPKDVILVKGAWSSASDSTTPLPEQGSVADDIYSNRYFGFAYPLAPGWAQTYSGPPPSESGYYVLAQIAAAKSDTGSRASLLIAAQDLFFALKPASDASAWIRDAAAGLQPDYQVERPVAPLSIANQPFFSFEYLSSIAGLHWYVLATQIRCHVVQFVFTGTDAASLETLVQGMSKTTFAANASPPTEAAGDEVPVCIKDYVRPENVLEMVDPIFTERRFNAIPVRIVIDTEGRVKHIHFLSAFPDQAKSISDALAQWRFKPYVRDGRRLEVETGILFGRATRPAASAAAEEAPK